MIRLPPWPSLATDAPFFGSCYPLPPLALLLLHPPLALHLPSPCFPLSVLLLLLCWRPSSLALRFRAIIIHFPTRNWYLGNFFLPLPFPSHLLHSRCPLLDTLAIRFSSNSLRMPSFCPPFAILVDSCPCIHFSPLLSHFACYVLTRHSVTIFPSLAFLLF